MSTTCSDSLCKTCRDLRLAYQRGREDAFRTYRPSEDQGASGSSDTNQNAIDNSEAIERAAQQARENIQAFTRIMDDNAG